MKGKDDQRQPRPASSTGDDRAGGKAGPDPVEEAGETTAADSIPTPADTRPVGQGTTADVEGESE